MSIITVTCIFGFLSFVLGIILGCTSYKFQSKTDPAIEIINELLPQSQCAQCGYSGCYSYAEAIVKNAEKINKCPPGGNDLILNIAKKLNIKVFKKNLNFQDEKQNSTVWIDEENCVGCSKCVSFCPVDAIIGAPNLMHTVLQKFCTGCNICLLHCPTNCIKIKKNTNE